MPALQKKHKKPSVHNIKSVMNTRYGAGNRTRTCTLLAVEPKSTESTNSTMPAYHYIIQISRRLSIPPAVERKRTQKYRKRTKITSDFQKLESRISKFPKIRTIGQER